jgi:hypothetical protein
MEVGFDADRDSMLVEIDHDQLYFKTISRTGFWTSRPSTESTWLAASFAIKSRLPLG